MMHMVLPDRLKRGHLIADIEVLRAIAVLVTVLIHQSLLTFRSIPGIDFYFDFSFGVDIFFAISGFVIVRSLLPTLPTTKSAPIFWRSIVAFWIRRIWRIWPTAWLWVGVALCASIFGRSDIWGKPIDVLQDAAAIILQVQNLHRVDPSAVQGPLLLSPYWSLSLEEQFYFLLPFLLFFVPRQRLMPVLAGLVLVQFFLNRYVFGAMPSNVLWAIRCDGLLLGVMIALSLDVRWLRDLLEPVFLGKSRLWRTAYLVLVLFLMSAVAGTHVVWFGTGLIAFLSAGLVWIASYDKNYIMADGVLKRLLVWIGLRSYAIYIIHVPAFYFTQSLWVHLSPANTNFADGHHFWQLLLTGSALIAILSDLNYRFIEVPLRNKGAAIARRLREQPAPETVN
jgi:peptidoglycan/LPS O-acetylase OafA/YrhL